MVLSSTGVIPTNIMPSDSENVAEVGHIETGTSYLIMPTASASSRKLPSWAYTSGSNLKTSSRSSRRQPTRTNPALNSTRNGKKSNGSVETCSGDTQKLNHPIVRIDDVECLSEIGNMCPDKTEGAVSNDASETRCLPISFKNDVPVTEISCSDSGKNIQSICRGENERSGAQIGSVCDIGMGASSGSQGGSVQDLAVDADVGSQGGSVLVPQIKEHVQVEPGNQFNFDLDGDGTGEYNGHFELYKGFIQESDKNIQSQHILRTLPPSLQWPLSTDKTKASKAIGGIGIDKERGDPHFQLHGVAVPEFEKKPSTQKVKQMAPNSLQSESTSESNTSMVTRRDGMDEDRGCLHFQVYRDLAPEVDKKLPSKQVPRRTLPLSFQPPVSHSQSKASAGTGGKEIVGVIVYENAGMRRLLPPSLMHGKSVYQAQRAVASNDAHHSGEVGENPTENNERLVFQAALQDLAQPKSEASLPDGLLSVPLLRHQRIALAWMLQKESGASHCLGGILADDQGLGKTISIIALIQMQRSMQPNSMLQDLYDVKTEALGLNNDDCCASDLVRVKKNGNDEDFKLSTPSKVRPACGTLVVCPASVLRQWAQELDEKVTDNGRLSVLVYHGSTRTKDLVELAKSDVVLTTYSIVAKEIPKQPLADDDDKEQMNTEKYASSLKFSTKKRRKKASSATKKGKKKSKGIDCHSLDDRSGSLARVRWSRVVLDEAQTIKNHRSQVSRACCGLHAKSRWCLSGTPIQNSVDDLYSYFRFLKFDPYADYSSFCSSIKLPISRNMSSGYKKLQAVLKTIMLRRTKGTLIDGKPIIQLPPKAIHLRRVDFTAKERDFYSRLEADSRIQFKKYAAAGTVKQNYANILLMLLRLRQACDHPLLVKGYQSNSVGKASLEMARKLSRKMLVNLLDHLKATSAICGVCNDPPEDAIVTMCGHVFCYQCISEHLIGDDNWCPAADCKEQLGNDMVFSRTTLQTCISDDDNATSPRVFEEFAAGQNICSSSKIDAVMEILHSVCKLNNLRSTVSSEDCSGVDFPSEVTSDRISERGYSNSHAKTDTSFDSRMQPEQPEKAIVFSQWTGMLDLLEISLNQSCIQYRRLDGTMSLASRERAVKDFTTNPEVTVMIMSLKAGNLGLNMFAACHVILLDPWWNPTTEDQAIDRAHRIGQTRPVNVSRLTIKDTMEDRILALQEEKRKMVSSAFGEDQSGSSTTRLTVEDLRYLFMV